MTIKAGCFLRILYVNGMIMTIAAGGALKDMRARRFTKDANRVAGRSLRQHQLTNEGVGVEAYVELKKSSVSRKNLARCLRCNTLRSKNA